MDLSFLSFFYFCQWLAFYSLSAVAYQFSVPLCHTNMFKNEFFIPQPEKCIKHNSFRVHTCRAAVYYPSKHVLQTIFVLFPLIWLPYIPITRLLTTNPLSIFSLPLALALKMSTLCYELLVRPILCTISSLGCSRPNRPRILLSCWIPLRHF